MWRSPPSRGCGSKFVTLKDRLLSIEVTPLAGVWIEMSRRMSTAPNSRVTPLAGVWIEMGRFAVN